MDERKQDEEMKEENKCGEKLKMEIYFIKMYMIFFFKNEGIDLRGLLIRG